MWSGDVSGRGVCLLLEPHKGREGVWSHLSLPRSKLAGGSQRAMWAHKHQGHTLGVAEQKMGSSLQQPRPRRAPQQPWLSTARMLSGREINTHTTVTIDTTCSSLQLHSLKWKFFTFKRDTIKFNPWSCSTALSLHNSLPTCIPLLYTLVFPSSQSCTVQGGTCLQNSHIAMLTNCVSMVYPII